MYAVQKGPFRVTIGGWPPKTYVQSVITVDMDKGLRCEQCARVQRELDLRTSGNRDGRDRGGDGRERASKLTADVAEKCEEEGSPGLFF